LSFVDSSDGAFLRDVEELSEGDRIKLVCAQLTGDLAALESKLSRAGQDGALVTAKINDLYNSANDQAKAARSLGSVFAQELLAADFRLGKAYSLGWDMASLVQDLPKDKEPETFKARLEKKNEEIRVRLRMLASLLPPNAGHSVRRSLDAWTEGFCGLALNEDGVPPDKARIRRVKETAHDIERQVDLPMIKDQMQTWRALLTGEKNARDMLHADELVHVSARTMGRLARAIGKGLKQAKLAATLLAGAVLLLLAIGVWLITQGGSGADVAGVTALVGSIGLTWKGVGSTIGRGLAKLEQPVWNAEVAEVIAVAITRLRPVKAPRWKWRIPGIEVDDKR
jgi:hypothetical protein